MELLPLLISETRFLDSLKCSHFIDCRQVNSEGSRLLHAFLASSSNDSMLAQQLVGIALHDKERLRAASFRAMSIFVNIRCSDRQNSENIEDVMRRL